MKRFAWVGLATLLLASCSASEQLPVLPVETNFELIGPEGRSYALQDFNGQVVWLYFGFTRCPDYCPTTLSKLSQARRLIDFRRERIRTIMITVDPDHDTARRMQDYLRGFDEQAVGLTGPPEEIHRVASRYRASFARVELETGGYTVDHSTYLYLLDDQGQLRHLFRHDSTPQQIAATTRLLLPAF